MLIAGGWDKMSYDVSSVTLHKDFVGVLANGQKCLPDLDGTVPDVDKKDKNCDECVGVAYASKQGRWIFRCGGKDQSDLCKNIDDTFTNSKTELNPDRLLMTQRYIVFYIKHSSNFFVHCYRLRGMFGDGSR